MTSGPANVVLEPNVKLKPDHIESLGADFEKSEKGFVDFLLLGNDGKPLIVLEAKSEDKDPRIAPPASVFAHSDLAINVVTAFFGKPNRAWSMCEENTAYCSDP
ncbi:hypothetical protein FB593_11336 [Rhizobium sp. SJZ105]|uniref:hypothetical protein n=1 Tax=Rhizobium sp. SJZ105 TaxID=2572678 RepID=UPI0011ADF213|nr:hypothetical protein [Rhizobium sp. SJZ105]TWC78239.1 hypothetical protein FB593_11336 [Rhizobium sp. SJZ105]